MAKYLVHGSYTVEGIRGVRKEGGTGRVQAVRALASSVGGSLESFYFAFGEDDYYIVVDLPDNTAAAAVATAVAATGAVSIKTTVLLTPEEVDAASKVEVSYRAPGTWDSDAPKVSAFHAELSAGGAATYLSFMGAEDADAVRGAYPAATYARLCELKRRYDPDDVFRANHNIRPA